MSTADLNGMQLTSPGMVGLAATVVQPDRLHTLFERQADARPRQVAVSSAGQPITYRELDSRANQLAHWLRSQGVGRGHNVALLLPRSADRYLALLAVLKVGAAYVPLDPEYPADRIAFILEDCAAQAIITVASLADKHAGFTGRVTCLDADAAAIGRQPAARLNQSPTQRRMAELQGSALARTGELPCPDDVCYIIYTSGTTGRPKGVAIEHRSAVNFVLAEQQVFQVQPHDRVYQGFSIAFDASVEEIWLAFAAGATLVVGTDDMMHAGPALGQMLTAARVSVLSCVPTLLAMLEDELPTVRLLILGGEVCPQHLVTRWCSAGRRVVNTYGPTEATVVATYADCDPRAAVTIGRPLPGYFVCLLDADLQPTPMGEMGELHIGGIGLARGYVGRPELTREKFIATPPALADGAPPRLYKTGDLARLTPDGDLEFLGRIDTQVKLRGFRVELAEIESLLLESPSVLAACVTVREDLPGVQQLVAYLVPRSGELPDADLLRDTLRERLPPYMVPALFEMVAGLPTLPSGKVDRRQLPPPTSSASATRATVSPPRTSLEARLVACWETLFAPASVSVEDDFFLDLGGHSLLAARMVSELRREPEWQHLSMLDVYHHPTVARLTAHVARQGTGTGSASPADAAGATSGNDGLEDQHSAGPFRPVSRAVHFCCGCAQTLGLYLVLGLSSLQWLAPYLSYTWLVEDGFPRFEAVCGAIIALLSVYPLSLFLSIGLKWLVIGRYRPGSYPLWGFYYFRWWLVNAVQSVVPVDYLAGSALINVYYRLMGAKIGNNVYLGTDSCSVFDLVSIGDDTSIGTDASLAGYTVADGMLHLGPITIGQRCFVGTRSVVREHTVMEDDAQLEDLSALMSGERIPAGERWIGSPAAPAADQSAGRVQAARPSRLRKVCCAAMHAAGVFVFPMLVLAAIMPGIMLLNHLNYEDDYYWYLVVTPLVAMSFTVLLCLEIAAVKWLLLGRVKAGTYPLASSFYFRKWFVDQLMELSLDVLGPLYATIYLAPWYRLLGARLGCRAEISTASFISPDLLQIDDEGFIADAVSLGAARVEAGTFTIAETRIGKRSFIGNSAMLPPGATIGDNCLIGCLSAPPTESRAAQPGTAWLGSPGFFLPHRQESTEFSAESTFAPSRKLWLQRAVIEFFRVTLPSTCFLILTSVLLSVVVLVQEHTTLLKLLLMFPLLYAACGLAATLFVVLMKWLLMGKYRPSEKPLWSTFVWRTELLTALHEYLADMFLTASLEGTPLLPWFFRLLGSKIGRRVFMETTALTEFDLITIGDDVALNHDVTVQTHLFEDRVMKMSHISIGSRCSVGAFSLVLYDTVMEPGARLGDLSLLMKGESLPAGSSWQGIPARRQSVTCKAADSVVTRLAVQALSTVAPEGGRLLVQDSIST